MHEASSPRRDLLRMGLVVLLVVAAYFAAAPWLGCVIVLPFWSVTEFTLRACTFGDRALPPGYGLPGFAGPYWGNLLVGIAYLVAAVSAALTKRSF